MTATRDRIVREPGRSDHRFVLIAVATGMAVANLYYAQPLLHTIGDDLGASEGRTGLVVTAAQIGYAGGLALLVPLGDLVSRRRLIPAVVGGMAVALLGAAAAPSLPVLAAALAVVGVGAVAAQLLVALTAGLAGEGERGRAVGTVMTGLLLGILLARTVAGTLAGPFGWRGVFVVAAGVAVVLAVALARLVPPEDETDADRADIGYGAVLASTVGLLRDLPGLRRSALLGALGFATFSVFWTTVSFHLAAEPFDWGDGAIGLLGLVGAAGALCATLAGRLADRGLASPGRIGAAVAVVVSFGLLWAGRHSVAAIVAGVVVLDIGVQGIQVLNQTIIYELAPEARSRITSAYMTVYFAGGALGSAVGAAVYDTGGWAGACVLGAGLGAAAVVVAGYAQIRSDQPPLRGRNAH